MPTTTITETTTTPTTTETSTTPTTTTTATTTTVTTTTTESTTTPTTTTVTTTSPTTTEITTTPTTTTETTTTPTTTTAVSTTTVTTTSPTTTTETTSTPTTTTVTTTTPTTTTTQTTTTATTTTVTTTTPTTTTESTTTPTTTTVTTTSPTTTTPTTTTTETTTTSTTTTETTTTPTTTTVSTTTPTTTTVTTTSPATTTETTTTPTTTTVTTTTPTTTTLPTTATLTTTTLPTTATLTTTTTTVTTTIATTAQTTTTLTTTTAVTTTTPLTTTVATTTPTTTTLTTTTPPTTTLTTTTPPSTTVTSTILTTAQTTFTSATTTAATSTPIITTESTTTTTVTTASPTITPTTSTVTTTIPTTTGTVTAQTTTETSITPTITPATTTTPASTLTPATTTLTTTTTVTTTTPTTATVITASPTAATGSSTIQTTITEITTTPITITGTTTTPTTNTLTTTTTAAVTSIISTTAQNATTSTTTIPATAQTTTTSTTTTASATASTSETTKSPTTATTQSTTMPMETTTTLTATIQSTTTMPTTITDTMTTPTATTAQSLLATTSTLAIGSGGTSVAQTSPSIVLSESTSTTGVTTIFSNNTTSPGGLPPSTLTVSTQSTSPLGFSLYSNTTQNTTSTFWTSALTTITPSTSSSPATTTAPTSTVPTTKVLTIAPTTQTQTTAVTTSSQGNGKPLLLPVAPGSVEISFFDKNDGYREVQLPDYFTFGTTYYKKVFVNVNGFISFDQAVFAFQPRLLNDFPSVIIAPFWADIDLNNNGYRANPGRIYFSCVSRRSRYSSIGPSADTFNAIQAHIRNYIDYSQSFIPTMVCSFTWSNVSPYPFGSDTWDEISTFQLILTTDNSNGRSFAIFSYGFSNWKTFRKNSQGYRMTSEDLSKYSTIPGLYSFRTSGTSAAFNLPFLTGPKGEEGRWDFQMSFPEYEYQYQSSYQCKVWYDDQSQSVAQYSGWLAECPCTLWQAIIDPRFTYYSYDWSSNYICFIQSFPTFIPMFKNFYTYVPATQKCCFFYSSWMWWSWFSNSWRMPWFWWSFSWLDTSTRYESGSMLLYHPYYYYGLHYQQDILPKQWCCRDSLNCDLYYKVRPQSYCWNYRMPFFGFLFGDPHITTLDGFRYTFNGWGEYWMIKTDQFQMQARTSQFIDSTGQLSNATIFTAFAFKDLQANLTSPRICVLMAPDEKNMIIKDENGQSNNLTDWFYSPSAENGTVYREVTNIQMSKNGSELIINFPSGIQVALSVEERALRASLTVPEYLKNSGFRGLYGNFDGNSTNDLQLLDGTILDSKSTERQIYDFGQSWAISSAADSYFWYNTDKNETFDNFQKKSFKPLFLDEDEGSCKVNKDEARKTCQANNKTDDACLFDYCITGNSSFAKKTLELSGKANETLQSAEEVTVSVIIAPVDFQKFTVKKSNTIYLSVNTSSDAFSMSFNSTFISGASLTCVNNPKCTNWEFTWTPINLNQVTLTFYGNDSNSQAKPATVSVLMCDCNGRGECDWNQVIDSNNTNSNPNFKLVACTCGEIYYGSHCNETVDFCSNYPCGSNRSCIPLNETELIELLKTTNGSSDITNATKPFKGYRCSACPNGTEVDIMDRCTDIDECERNISNCDNATTTCFNLVGSYQCNCKNGFFKSNQLNSCSDIDECSTGISRCQQLCNNTIGSYNCSCYDGYVLVEATQTCQKTSNCTVDPKCDFCLPNDNCSCFLGYKKENNSCVDIKECTISPAIPICGPPPNTCHELNGSYQCGCENGAYKKEGYQSCVYCDSGKYGAYCNQTCNCNSNNCSRTYGCLQCDGNGWTGPNCDVDIDECNTTSNPCGDGNNCSNTPGSYKCSCKPWFYFDASSKGSKCIVQDACQVDATGNKLTNTACLNNGQCIDGKNETHPGNFSCNCAGGFKGDRCKENINDCDPEPCLNGGKCVDKTQGYECNCVTDFTGPKCEYKRATEGVSTDSTAISTSPTSGLKESTSTLGLKISTSGVEDSTSTRMPTIAATVNTTTAAPELPPSTVTLIIFPIVFSSLTFTSFSFIFGFECLRWVILGGSAKSSLII